MYKLILGRKTKDYTHKKTALNKYNESTEPIKAVIWTDNNENNLICYTQDYIRYRNAIRNAFKELLGD